MPPKITVVGTGETPKGDEKTKPSSATNEASPLGTTQGSLASDGSAFPNDEWVRTGSKSGDFTPSPSASSSSSLRRTSSRKDATEAEAALRRQLQEAEQLRQQLKTKQMMDAKMMESEKRTRLACAKPVAGAARGDGDDRFELLETREQESRRLEELRSHEAAKQQDALKERLEKKRMRKQQQARKNAGGEEESDLPDDFNMPTLSLAPQGRMAKPSTTVIDDLAGDLSGIDDRMMEGERIAPVTKPLLRYSVLKDQPIGRGGYGAVFKGFDSQRGSHVAVKQTEMGPRTKSAVAALRSEFDLLKTFDHPNVVKVLEYNINEEDSVAEFFMEWMSNGSVQTIIDQTQFRLHEMVVKRQLVQALKGLAYLHSKNVVHRDIKPGNMLVDGDGVVKLSDFGTSVLIEQGNEGSQTVMVGTIPYLAPECFMEAAYGPASDIWALACSVVEMSSGIVPWTDKLSQQKMEPEALAFFIGTRTPPDHHPTIPSHLSAELKEILEMCFDADPNNRPTAADLLQMPYFSNEGVSPTAEPMKGYQAAAKEHRLSRESSSSSGGMSSGIASWSNEMSSSTLRNTHGATSTIKLMRSIA